MNKILDFANTNLHDPFKFDSCKKVLDNWNGATVYLVSSQEAKGLYLGWPVFVKETNGILEEVKSSKDKIKIMSKSKAQKTL